MTGPPTRMAGEAGRLYSVSGTEGSGSNPARAISSSNCSAVRKTWGWPENSVNTNASPGRGRASAGIVCRENVNT